MMVLSFRLRALVYMYAVRHRIMSCTLKYEILNMRTMLGSSESNFRAASITGSMMNILLIAILTLLLNS